MTHWTVTLIGNVFCIVVTVRALSAWARGEYVRMVIGLVVAVATAALIWVPRAVVGLGDGGLPWEAILLGIGGAVFAYALVGGTRWVRRWYKRRTAARRHREKQAAALEERRAAIEADHDAVRDEYGAYLADVLAVLDRPALDDVTNPKTAALLHALDAADDARRGDDLDAYRDAVSCLKTAWRAADEHARKAGTRHLPERERTAVRRARKLLARALDTADGNEYERRTAYAQARELLDGVLTIPRQAAAALESRHRLSLSKAEESRS